MDLFEKMATFVRVVEAGSLSAASKQLRLSAAAVSRQIATLEGELGTALLLRSTRRMSITAAGQGYYESCLRILREVDEAKASARGDGIPGTLTVSAPVTFGLASVVPHLRTLARKRPALRIDLRLEDRIVDLVVEGVDVAIRVGVAVPETTELVAHRLFAFNRIVVASPSYLKKRGEPKTPEALAGHCALAHALNPDAESWTLVDGERRTRIPLHVASSSNAGHVLRDLALDGAGIALLPAWFVHEEIERRALRHILPRWRSESVTVHAIHRAVNRGEARVRALVSHLKTSYAERAGASA
jgi:DNA-binding transcriptional LysR family regulator